MPNPYFRFKQFTVYHDRCAMKVGTDGVLLGAWTKLRDNDKILDVGAGSGLISLMLAQRNRTVSVDPVEIDTEAVQQANENIGMSPFRNISSCKNISFQDFSDTCPFRYDLIVSNPPFFHLSLKSPVGKRSIARHTDSFLIEDFIRISAKMLSPEGRISFIYPSLQKDYLLSLADENNLYVSRLTDVHPTPSSISKRLLLEFSKNKTVAQNGKLVIETERHKYTPEFIYLVKDFYLKY